MLNFLKVEVIKKAGSVTLLEIILKRTNFY